MRHFSVSGVFATDLFFRVLVPLYEAVHMMMPLPQFALIGAPSRTKSYAPPVAIRRTRVAPPQGFNHPLVFLYYLLVPGGCFRRIDQSFFVVGAVE